MYSLCTIRAMIHCPPIYIFRPYVTLTLSILSCTDCYNKQLSDNLQFHVFENFNLNKINFIDELIIISEIQTYRQKLSNCYHNITSNLEILNMKKMYSPINLFHLLRRHILYKSVIISNLKMMLKVFFKIYVVEYTAKSFWKWVKILQLSKCAYICFPFGEV